MQHKKYSRIITGTLAIIAFVFLMGVGAQAGQHKILYTFTGGADGSGPYAGVIFDAAGNLYGTTQYGGSYGAGTVFELSPTPTGAWAEKVLYTFTGAADGGWPAAGLSFDSAGNLYGTASAGGNNGAYCNWSGCGVVFELTSTPTGEWTETIVHSFTGDADGSNPIASLVFDSVGNLYGTTWEGAHSDDFCYLGCGVVFELSPTPAGEWAETTLYTWMDGWDGSNSWANLILDTAGNLYGVSFNAGRYGYGNVFELVSNPEGTWSGKVLYQFKGGLDGGHPAGALMFDSAGNLYGTTGSTFGSDVGIVFQLVPNSKGSWTKRTLHRFSGGADGASPQGGLIFDTAGNLYGTTCFGGTHGDGVVYKLTHSSIGAIKEAEFGFDGHNGANPWGSVVFDAAGNLYGTTSAGGKGFGTVYEIIP